MKRLARRWSALYLVLIAFFAGTGPPVHFNVASAVDASTAGSGAPNDATGPQPLLFVLDLSGSMNENDGTGIVKLTGAKESLVDVLRLQPRGAQIGVWTFPGSASSCSPGGYVAGLRVGPIQDPTALSATIRSLKADGDTPTGPALLASVQSLREQGLQGGTVVLVSDGESNCGQPPCEVAKQIVQEGLFDITVQAVGFRTSASGRQELECVANATRGSYYDITDSAGLADRLKTLAVPALELIVDATAEVGPGAAATVRASVQNNSTTATSDVSLTLSFSDAGSRSLFPSVIPPRFRLGNVPPGGAVERTWTMVPGSGQQGGIAAYRVTAWGSNAPASSVEGRIQVSAEDLALSDAGPLLTDVEGRGGTIAILGDSYSSGEGAGDYVDGTDLDPNRCHQSLRTYGAPLYDDDQVRLIACSGAVTANITAPHQDQGVTRAQIDLLQDGAAPDLVLMTIGGNDIEFEKIVESCVWFLSCLDDRSLISDTHRRIDQLPSQLAVVYKQVWASANTLESLDERNGRWAPVIVLGYPKVLPRALRGPCNGFNAEETLFGNAVVDELNLAIKAGVETARSDGADIRFVDSVEEAIPSQHSACAPDPHVNDVDLLIGLGALVADFLLEDLNRVQELMHPNVQGYRSMTNALVQWSRDQPSPLTTPSAQQAPPTIEASDPVIIVDLDGAREVEVESIRIGQSAELRLRGFAPGSTVTVTVNSTPRTLASLTADSQGVANGIAYIPLDLPPGQHTIQADGFAPDGSVRELSQPVSVAGPLPWWWWPLVGTAVIFLLIAPLVVRKIACSRQGVVQ